MGNKDPELPPIREKVLEGWALMDWDPIVEKIIEPCEKLLATWAGLVHSVATRLMEYLPTSAFFAMQKLAKLERQAMTTIISCSSNAYCERYLIGPVPWGVCAIITEFSVGS